MLRAMARSEGLRSESMTKALDAAIAGKNDALFDQLAVASGLPGTRANITIAQAFAAECASRGKTTDRLLFTMAGLSPEAAPGASAREFLPLCGILGLGERAASDAGVRAKVLALLHDAAEDLRFRVREAVPIALARIGDELGDVLVADVASWMDGYFQATAVLLAIGNAQWLGAIDDANEAIARLDEAYVLARDAPRAAARWPGRKALVEALGTVPAALAARFGRPVFEKLAAWTKTEQPELREAIEKNLRGGNLASRYADDVAMVRAAIAANTKTPRDAARIVEGMRGRGKKRGRR
jgi:hypothetical protein